MIIGSEVQDPDPHIIVILEDIQDPDPQLGTIMEAIQDRKLQTVIVGYEL